MRKSLLVAIAVVGVAGWMSPAVATPPLRPAVLGVVSFGAPPGTQGEAGLLWLTLIAAKVTPGLTHLYPNLRGIVAGALPANYSWGAASLGLAINAFPVG